MAKRKYFTLLQWQDNRWAIHFGDYDREVVEQERDDLKDSTEGALKAHFKIITTGVRQAEIDAMVAKLNAIYRDAP
jgi:hypothetical protein